MQRAAYHSTETSKQAQKHHKQKTDCHRSWGEPIHQAGKNRCTRTQCSRWSALQHKGHSRNYTSVCFVTCGLYVVPSTWTGVSILDSDDTLEYAKLDSDVMFDADTSPKLDRDDMFEYV